MAILDAAERALVERGPAGIRIQEVAADVGVSHPTVLHHFGTREALVEAVVARALDSLEASLVAAVGQAAEDETETAAMLKRVFDTLVGGGHARALFWLALAGHERTIEQLHIRAVAEAVHEVRCAKWKEKKGGASPKLTDTYFTVLLSALALLSLSVIEGPVGVSGEGPLDAAHFRTWLAKLVHRHLEGA